MASGTHPSSRPTESLPPPPPSIGGPVSTGVVHKDPLARGMAGVGMPEPKPTGEPPVDRSGSRQHRMIVALLAAAVVVVVGGILAALLFGGATGGATHTIGGTLTLSANNSSNSLFGSSSSTFAGDGSQCDGTNVTPGGYDDITSGGGVTVENGSGNVVATGQLGGGTVQNGSCVFPITVSNVPDSSFYKIEVSHRGFVTFSKSQLESDGWNAGLTLGNNS